jgi:hypothetical protein
MLTHSVNKSNAGLCAYTELKSDRNTYQYVFGYSNVLGNVRANDDKEIAYLSYVSSQKNSMGDKIFIYLKAVIEMAKGQKRSNKEVKKQKQSKTITVLAPNTVGLPKPRKLSDTYILPKKLTP